MANSQRDHNALIKVFHRIWYDTEAHKPENYTSVFGSASNPSRDLWDGKKPRTGSGCLRGARPHYIYWPCCALVMYWESLGLLPTPRSEGAITLEVTVDLAKLLSKECGSMWERPGKECIYNESTLRKQVNDLTGGGWSYMRLQSSSDLFNSFLCANCIDSDRVFYEIVPKLKDILVKLCAKITGDPKFSFEPESNAVQEEAPRSADDEEVLLLYGDSLYLFGIPPDVSPFSLA